MSAAQQPRRPLWLTFVGQVVYKDGHYWEVRSGGHFWERRDFKYWFHLGPDA